jgi:glycosyltransferase involved in cell wall biosynthesis
MLRDFDEAGFFDRVWIAFPFARTSIHAQVSDRVFAQDIGTDWLPFATASRRLRRIAAPVHILRALVMLRRGVLRDDIDVIRATDPCFAGLMGWLTSRLTGRPLCVSIHADFDQRHRLGGASAATTVFGSRAVARWIERFVLRRAGMVMPIRESLRPYALRHGAPRDRIRVIPHGTDLKGFVTPATYDVRAQLGISSATKIISFVGRISRENYIDDVLELARRLSVFRQDFLIVVAGGGVEDERIRATVAGDSRLSKVIRLVGFQPREVVAALRQTSSASLCLMGGFSLIEACAAGSPVVSYAVEWHDELVRDGKTGFLVTEHDVASLTTVVGQLLDDPRLGATLGSAARELALSRHDLDATTNIKRQCYLDLLASAACGR